jgi:collagenase-like PrtC family protease
VFVALNTFPQPEGWERWRSAVDQAAELGVDAVIAADISVLDYACRQHPQLPLHLSVQGSATNYEAIRFYHEHFGIRRVVLPRVLSLPQVRHVLEHSPVGYRSVRLRRPVHHGGRPLPAVVLRHRRVAQHVRGLFAGQGGALGGNAAGAGKSAGRAADGPLRARRAGRLSDPVQGPVRGWPIRLYYAIEEPTSLNTLELLPELQAMGIAAIKIEGRQRSPAYVTQVTKVWRAAIDACRRNPAAYTPKAEWQRELGKVSEGHQTTLGAYHRTWQ